MNKSGTRQKRSIGKESPLSKRPKLEISIRTRNSPKKDKVSPKKYNGNFNNNDNKAEDIIPTASDWDEDFSSDMLEKVCLIADLSQAMVNNEPPTKEIQRKSEAEIFESHKPSTTPKISVLNLDSGSVPDEVMKLKSELEKLQDKLKTKEGEVHILRSQLKQNEDAKQVVALQNIKLVEEIQKKYNEKISATEKELESTKTKLQFKDMEYKTLSERCRQLEYNMSKTKLVENQVEGTKVISSMSQTNNLRSQRKQIETENITGVVDTKESVLHFEFPSEIHHEGKNLAKYLCPEFFKFIEEPSVLPFYSFRSEIDHHQLDFDKKKKYQWTNLPKQSVFIKDLYNPVTSLFTQENFSCNREWRKVIEEVFETCGKILIHTKEVLLFLEKIQLHNTEYDDIDQSLLENEDEVEVIKIKDLLDGKRLNEEECGIEGRRTLALIFSLIKSSDAAFDLVKNNIEFLKLLKDLAAVIGNIRRPLRYTGVLIGITFILQRILEEKNLKTELLSSVNETVEEVIFARPKLDVLREVVNVLAAGKPHLEFLQALCRKASVKSCALYMDSKLKQAMFFTKNACPLKILCMQIMGLASLPSSQNIRWDVTDCFIKWLNNSINVPNCKLIKWLPINSPLTQEDRCFDVTECLLYLLTLCSKDYLSRFFPQDVESIQCKTDEKKFNLISTIGHGAVLLKRIIKADQKQLNNTYSLRFAVLLKALIPNKSNLSQCNHLNHLSSVQTEAISWITDLLESDLRNQDLKHNISALPDIDVFNALTINDESKIY